MKQEPVAVIRTGDFREKASWVGLAELAQVMPSGWSLAGGSLVRLHAAERGSTNGRSTRDIDVILDVRGDPRSIKRMEAALEACGFVADGFNLSGQNHRWVRGDAQIDVLAPDFLGARLMERSHAVLGRLLSTRGAQFGLDRTERILVVVDDLEIYINRPDLVGALYQKCSALLVQLDSNQERHLFDIALLVDLLNPADRRDLLGLRTPQKRRIISGLIKASRGIGTEQGSERRLLLLIDLLEAR